MYLQSSGALRVLISPLRLFFESLATENKQHICRKTKAKQHQGFLNVILYYFPLAFFILGLLLHTYNYGWPRGGACCYLLCLNNCMSAKLESGQQEKVAVNALHIKCVRGF